MEALPARCAGSALGSRCGGISHQGEPVVITTYSVLDARLVTDHGFISAGHFEHARWIDLLNPSFEEEQHVEALLGCDLPTRDEMREIEDSRRLVARHDALLLTATVMVNSNSEYPRAEDVTFVLTPGRLVTVRYAAPRAFALFAERGLAEVEPWPNAEHVLLGLFECLLERIADHIEATSDDLDRMVHDVLAPEAPAGKRPRLDYAQMLRRLERDQILVARSRVSLMSLDRLAAYLCRPELGERVSPTAVARAQVLRRDAHSLMEHTGFLANSINFELSAILGMVNIEQNSIIKFFSVVSVVFLPPTLVASLYGMNFELMPELHWHLGYPWALGLMVTSAVAPYFWFRRRGWL